MQMADDGRILVRGDLHGDIVRGLSYRSYPCMRDMTMDDAVVVCGDIGLGWEGATSRKLRYDLDFLESKRTNFVLVRGNHDNCDYWDACPETAGNRTVGLVRGRLQNAFWGDKTYSNVFLVNSTAVASICGKRCLLIGGAQSHDADRLAFPHEKERIRAWRRKHVWYRIVGRTWWEKEDVNVLYARSIALENLYSGRESFQCVFTHEAPASFLQSHAVGGHRLKPTAGSECLEDIKARAASIEKWFFGHYHRDFSYESGAISMRACFEDMVDADTMEVLGSRYNPYYA